MPAGRRQLAPLALQLLEQLGVLDRQHRLVGEGSARDRPYSVGERARRLAAEHERADQAVLAQLRAGAVDVDRKRAQLVAIGDIDALGELAARDPAQPLRDLGERLHDRPREDVAEAERQDDAAERERDHDQARRVIGALARLDLLEHVGLGHVDQLIGQALEPVGERPRLAQLHLARLFDLPGARALDRPGHDRDEAVVVLAHARQQIDLALRHVLQPVEVVAELAELAQDAVELALVLGQQRGGDAVELARGVVLHLAVRGDLALQLDQLLGARVHPAQHLQADRAEQDDQRDHREKRDQQLGLHSRRNARDQADRKIAQAHQGSFTRLSRSRRNSSSSNR